jgi:hypothetical protein
LFFIFLNIKIEQIKKFMAMAKKELSRFSSFEPPANDLLLFLLFLCSVEIMFFKKTKRGERYQIGMGPRALTASSGLAPWSMAVDRSSAA